MSQVQFVCNMLLMYDILRWWHCLA